MHVISVINIYVETSLPPISEIFDLPLVQCVH